MGLHQPGIHRARVLAGKDQRTDLRGVRSGEYFQTSWDERLGTPLLCDSHSATGVRLLARQQWDRKCRSSGSKDALFVRLSLFVNRRFAPMERGAVRRQAIDPCIPAQNDDTL